MLKEFLGKETKTPWGSLRSFRVLSPVLAMVVGTFRFSNPWTLGLKVKVQTVKLGAAKMVTAEVTRAIREEWREEETL